MKNKPKVLVIEDDKDFRESLQLLLERKFDVQVMENGFVGVKEALFRPPNLILLDLKMPNLDGFQTCQMLRADKDFDHIPIIVVSGYNTDEDRTRAFELGADDFIAKPFSAGELMARVQRKLVPLMTGKIPSKQEAGVVSCGNIKLNPRKQEVLIGEQALQLSALEFRLLYVLVTHCDEIVKRENLIEQVWAGQPVSERIIDPHIFSLRNKLEGCDHTIAAIYGQGYIFKALS